MSAVQKCKDCGLYRYESRGKIGNHWCQHHAFTVCPSGKNMTQKESRTSPKWCPKRGASIEDPEKPKGPPELLALKMLLAEYQRIKAKMKKLRDQEIEHLTLRNDELENLTYTDLQNQYGYEMITEEEFYAKAKQLQDYQDGKESTPETVTPLKLCYDMLLEDISDISYEIRQIEFDMKTPEEQERIRKLGEEMKDRVLKRRAAREGRG